jgi:hypothetical protein
MRATLHDIKAKLSVADNASARFAAIETSLSYMKWILGALGTMLLLILAILYQQYSAVARLNSDLDQIVPQRIIRKISASDLKTLTDSLPVLLKVTEQPISQVHPDPDTLEQIAVKLRQIPQDSVDYWPAVLRFIQFASSANAKDVPPPGAAHMNIANINIHGDGNKALSPHFRNENIILLDGGHLENMTLEHSRIIFTEHPVELINVRFIDCVFEMPNIETPSPYLKKAGGQLLASQFTEIKEAS